MAVTLLLTPWLLVCVARASPGEAPLDDPTGSDFIRATERDEDPLAIDRVTGDALDEAARSLARRRARPRAVPVERGEVVAGARGLRESSHRVQLRWAHGVQYVHVEFELENRGTQAAEASYRLALPEGARAMEVRTCRGSVCAVARPEVQGDPPRPTPSPRRDTVPAPTLRARRIHDERGPALALHVSPVEHGGPPVRVSVEYGLEAPVRGGVVRLTLPARGYDPRAHPAEVEVSARGALLPPLPSPLVLDPWIPLELAARQEPGKGTLQRHVTRARCGTAQCTRDWQARPPEEARSPAELWVLVDRSPSMEGPPRGRVELALRALLASAPLHGTLRIGVFDEAANDLTAEATAPKTVPFDALHEALLRPAAPRTRLSSGLALALSSWVAAPRKPPARLVVLSDGRFTLGETEQRAAARWRATGIPCWVVHLDDDPLRPQRMALVRALGGQGVHPAEALFSTARRGDVEPLAELLAHLWDGPAGDAPTPGEQRLRMTRGPRRHKPSGTAEERRWLAAQATEAPWHTPTTQKPSGGDPGAGPPVTQAPTYTSTPTATPPPDTGLPAESVLNMLRDQLIPKARACLRRDRAGRADHAVHVTFHFLLERREILEAQVEGELTPALRDCLDGCLGALQIPAFSGRFRVRYPVFTERATEPPRIELAPDVTRHLDRLFEHERPP